MIKKILLLILLSFYWSTPLFSQDTLNNSNGDRLTWDKTKKNSKELKQLLSNPLDLQKFKKLKPGRSNSGGGPTDKYFFKPSYNGFYYYYFLFPAYGVHGPRITTYKKGKEIGGYMDTSEVFIQLSCDAVDKDLGKANILSLTHKQIVEKFGDNFIKKGGTIIYQYNKTLLIICYDSRNWFKIVKLKKNYSSFDEIEAEKNLISYF